MNIPICVCVCIYILIKDKLFRVMKKKEQKSNEDIADFYMNITLLKLFLFYIELSIC